MGAGSQDGTTGEATTLVADAERLTRVSAQAAAAYAAAKQEMIARVDRELSALASSSDLIGDNPTRVMFDNHRNHAEFIATVLTANDYGLLARTVPWVYSAYRSHGFSDDYFPAVLRAWLKALDEALEPAYAAEIAAVYEWMLTHHEDFRSAAEAAPAPPAGRGELAPPARDFLASLLDGRVSACRTMAEDAVREPQDVASFYLDVVQPAMYRIGELWERGEISVAEEHLASAIVSRVLAALYPKLIQDGPSKGRVVITAAPNEFHDIGGRMAADLLEVDGWDVTYLGANTPDTELIDLLQKLHPDVLGLSVAMPFNLDRAKRTVDAVRQDAETGDIRVLAGGRVFVEQPQATAWVGADATAADARDGVRIAADWWSETGD